MAAAKKGTLQLRLHAPATPDHVAVAASLFRDMLVAAFPDLRDGSVTMVVSNFAMTAGLRHQDGSGKSAIAEIARFIREPEVASHKRPALVGVADVLADYADELIDYQPEFWSHQKLIKRLDTDFVGALSKITQETATLTLRGDTIIYSPVYRVGRTGDKDSNRARVLIDGKRLDIRIKKGYEALFFDAAKTGATYSIYVEAAWFRGESGNLELDARRSRLANVEPWKSGMDDDLMQDIRRYPNTLQGTDGILDEGF